MGSLNIMKSDLSLNRVTLIALLKMYSPEFKQGTLMLNSMESGYTGQKA